MKRTKTWMVAVALLCAIWVHPAYTKEKKSAEQSAAKSAMAAVDLNTASEAELDKLPGVGPATAKKIIAGRPYSSVGDLTRSGIPAKTIEKITPLVTVSASNSAGPRGNLPASSDRGRITSKPDAGTEFRIVLSTAVPGTREKEEQAAAV